jgi:2-haloacid dehalogenase
MLGYWLDRRKTPYPHSFLAPDLAFADLVGLANTLQEPS